MLLDANARRGVYQSGMSGGRSFADDRLSQAAVAKKMGTKAPAVTRLETSLSGSTHSPTIATLKKYAEAVGCTQEIRLVRRRAADG